ncbi:hypothetical protein N7457_007468 [Penicillium paradoxum]|uniref:uncharacterized protein n=1 Tax=Penicillium paradoxum TaxID=176176 RepID=UPI002548E094|nr:uncharacterized protein N7457_007468 [Penicillium paradoxum]KAJ5779748.1 hypothetical protein N7457_007468 [Penicillium paradoxum]
MKGHIFSSLLSDDRVQILEDKIGYHFTSRDLLREALQSSNGVNGDANKNLALIGDAVIDTVLVIHGYGKKQPKGMISDVKSQRAGNKYLTAQGFSLGIDQFVVINPSQTVVGVKVMATTMEAIIGAVFLDSGHQLGPCIKLMVVLGLSWPE